MESSELRRGRSPSERGYTLAAVLVIVTILAMVLAYTIPEQWSRVMKRERELHTIWVMKQYARAIQEFQKKRGTFPVSLEQLTEQKNPRIIRQLYPNPLTGELDWALVPFGTPTPATNPAAGAVAPGAPTLPQQPTTPQPTTPATGAGGQQVGPFIGVRLAMRGESIVPLNGQTKYEEWVYTINELQRDLAAAAGGAMQPFPPGDPRNPQDPRLRPPQPVNP
jgi:type II secretory pathway pseudopilin PulG